LIAWPTSAWAHNLGFRSDPNRPVIDYVWLGFLHMATGWDHLLFITGVVLLAGTLGRATKLISLFVVGHSATLLVASIAGWRLNPVVVDVVIALSVAYVGGQGVRWAPLELAGSRRGRVRVRARAWPRALHAAAGPRPA